MRLRRPLYLPLVILLAACASAPVLQSPPAVATEVSYRAVVDPGVPRYHPSSAQVAVAPTMSSGNLAPAYPSALVAQNLPAIDVHAKLVVDTQGTVKQALIAGEASADAHTHAFDSAVRQAVLAWTFDPLRMTTWKDMPDGSSQRVASQPMPFSQDYVFRFSLRDGKPVVSSATPPL